MFFSQLERNEKRFSNSIIFIDEFDKLVTSKNHWSCTDIQETYDAMNQVKQEYIELMLKHSNVTEVKGIFNKKMVATTIFFINFSEKMCLLFQNEYLRIIDKKNALNKGL